MANDYSNKYVDGNGLSHFWSLIKQKFVAKETGKGLSTNDYTAAEKNKLNGIEAGAQKNTITGVKGNSESAYRTGQVNLTPANIGALAANANAVSASKLNAKKTIDGVEFDGGANIIHYGESSTAAATGEKVVTCSGFKLDTGAWVAVKFTVTNTAAVSGLKLNVNSTGAKAIKYRNANVPAVGTLSANRVYLFVYDGTDYELIGDLDTTYSVFKGATASAAGGAGLVPAPAAVDFTGGHFLMANGQWGQMSFSQEDELGEERLGDDGVEADPSGLRLKLYLGTGTNAKLAASTLLPVFGSPNSNGATDFDFGLLSSTDWGKLRALPTAATLSSSYATKSEVASTYAKKTDIANMYKYKGGVTTYANLPTSGNTAGDVYDVQSDGHNYAWNGSAWDDLGGTFRIETITNTEIDTIVAS